MIMSPCRDNLCSSGNPQMTNLRTDKIVFFLHLTKIGTDKNKAIYSIGWPAQLGIIERL